MKITKEQFCNMLDNAEFDEERQIFTIRFNKIERTLSSKIFKTESGQHVISRRDLKKYLHKFIEYLDGYMEIHTPPTSQTAIRNKIKEIFGEELLR